MGFAQRAMCVFLLVVTALDISLAAVYKVGDSKGWTSIGQINYTAWAASKTFRVGDTILFEYNKQFHNVMQVTHLEFQACNVSSVINTFSTGNDSIVIKRTGHFYYLCGIPGHCLVGQKVDIRVPKSSEATAPSPSGSSTASPAGSPSLSPPGAIAGAPGPSVKSSAPYPSSKGLVALLLSLVVVLGNETTQDDPDGLD
ncbi:hypothetical protein NE237_012252 [Protea cynaroides]|uniref:Phytocyanin domain-containing protein n=1 Tax=Protea cynaroides TaxID=273540 RepID=A0A9Q0GXL1_9MAGN|nr:hypothetical protein NE237_012252 [Protea cynaroides]